MCSGWRSPHSYHAISPRREDLLRLPQHTRAQHLVAPVSTLQQRQPLESPCVGVALPHGGGAIKTSRY